MKIKTKREREVFDAMNKLLSERGYRIVEGAEYEDSTTYRKWLGVGPTVTMHRTASLENPIKVAVSDRPDDNNSAWNVEGLDHHLTSAEREIRRRSRVPRTFARVEVELQRHDEDDTTTIDSGEPVFRIVVTDGDGKLIACPEGMRPGGLASYLRNISEQMALRP